MSDGNTLGVRRYFEYITDKDVKHSYLTDESLGTAVGAALDDTNPPFRRRFKPRGVYCQALVNDVLVRKFVIIPKTENENWTDNSKTITIDGVAFKTTGRRGESLTFGSNPTSATPQLPDANP